MGFQKTPLHATGGNPWSGGQAGNDTEAYQESLSTTARSGLSNSTLKATLTHTNIPQLRTYPWGRQAIFSSADHGRFYSPPIDDRVYTDATLTVGSTTITFPTGADGFTPPGTRDVGHVIAGSGIPNTPPSTIVAVNSTTNITISAAVTSNAGTGKTINVVDQPPPPQCIDDYLRNAFDTGCQYTEVYEFDIEGSGVNPTINNATFTTHQPRLKTNIPGALRKVTPTPSPAAKGKASPKPKGKKP